eukprot:GHVH01004278.1.p1 GENE.GHVH01004278.1~~GHVH01004278.1.p1  ORF type:complete len:166 (+),score=28.37 GHVH01004278.1:56-553(+)
MPHSYGYRSRTRHILSNSKGEQGMPGVAPYLRVYKRGDYVAILNDPSIHKGMTHRIYHGKIGRVFDIRNRAIGVEVAKRAREKQIRKRIYVRTEHIKPWAGRQDFLDRIKKCDEMRSEAKKTGVALPAGYSKRAQIEIVRAGGILDVNVSDVNFIKIEPFDENIY